MADKKIITGVRFDPDLHEKIRQIAFETKESMNAIIIRFIKEGIKKIKPSQPE